MNKLPCDYAACDGTINGETCPQKATCLRCVGVQAGCARQVWMTVSGEVVGECSYFIETEGGLAK
jgi:hypothetical protein